MEWDRARDYDSSVRVPLLGGGGVNVRHEGVVDSSWIVRTGACCVVGRRAERAWGQESVAYHRASFSLCTYCIAVSVNSGFWWHPRALPSSWTAQLVPIAEAEWICHGTCAVQELTVCCASHVGPIACLRVSVLGTLPAETLALLGTLACTGNAVCDDQVRCQPLPCATWLS